jgi:tetratricopeptide (TPR) repeat protein
LALGWALRLEEIAMKRYTDLEIRVQHRDANGYPVELTLDGEQALGRGVLSPSIVPWLPSADSAADGERLFALLFADDRLKKGWALARGRNPQRRVRLRIDPDAPELHGIPWELLRDPSDGRQPQDLAASDATPFSRYLESDLPRGLPVNQRPVKVLVAIANPSDLRNFGLAALDVTQEWPSLQAATAGQNIVLALLPGSCTLRALEAELKQGAYHVLHLVAHGAFAKQEGHAVLFLADDADHLHLVSDTEFRDMLARQLGDADAGREDHLRLIFLDSCDTAQRDTADAFRGLAPQLIAAGVPAVVAMQEQVPIVTAQAFARTFYRRLLAHGMVDLAANEARSHVITARLPGASVPVLLMRLKDGQLLARTRRPTKLLTLLAGIAMLLGIVSAFLLARPTLVMNLQTQGAEALDAGQGSVAIGRFQLANRLMLGRDANVHFNLGNAYELVGNNYAAAEEEYQSALNLDDTHAPAINNLARLLIIRRHDPDSALTQLLPFLQQTGDVKSKAVLHKNIGWAYLEKNWYQDALDELQGAEQLFLAEDASYVDISAYLAETYGLIAQAQTGLGRNKEAQDAWQSSLGYALAVVASPSCTTTSPGRKPGDCRNAEAWSREAEHSLSLPPESPP